MIELDQYTNDARFFHRLFERGTLYEVQLFLDFEDWRMGSRGFSWYGSLPPHQLGSLSIPKARANPAAMRGAHFWPFDQPSLGPDIPCYLGERNQGLVLDRSLHYAQVTQQEDLIDDLQGRIDWLSENIEFATMGPVLRSRKDVKENISWVIADFRNWWENEVQELRELNTSQCVGRRCGIMFNTSSLELTGAITGRGVVRKTAAGTEVALFTFNSIYLGPELEVKVVGQRALSLLSKTSAVINTTINIVPGTLGGFQGGGSVARLASDALNDEPRAVHICDLGKYCSYNTSNPSSFRSFDEPLITNNVNGPGSGNLRIHSFVMKTFSADIREIQTITTRAQNGQTLSGGFVVMFKKYSTPIIPHDVSPLQLKSIIEDNLNIMNPYSGPVFSKRDLSSSPAGIGIVNVTRSSPDSQEGFTWTITFTSSIGNIEQLRVKSYLFGIKANVTTATVRDGNEIGGTFRLHFQGFITEPIPAAATAAQFSQKLRELPIVRSVFVRRTDPTGNCDDGLCANGPYPARGLLWTVFVTTEVDNITPLSPTSSLAFQEADHFKFIADSSSLRGINSTIEIYQGTIDSPDYPQNLLNVTIPFSLAYGGAGGSYGGSGGKGYGDNLVGSVYNDMKLGDLLGGSGGCMRTADPFQINAVLGSATGRGGHGGGAIEIVAANDLTIGSWGKLIARGGDGEQTSEGGGGGGSGGAILLTSGTVIVVQGTLDVTGGNGGYGGANFETTMAGGGGGGGRIAIFADSITTKEATINIDGGQCGVYKTPIEHDVLVLNLRVDFALALLLDSERLESVVKSHLESIFPAGLIEFNVPINNIQATVTPNVYLTTAEIALTMLDIAVNETSSKVLDAASKLQSVKGTNIAEVVFLYGQILNYHHSTMVFVDDINSNCDNHGDQGTYYTEALMTTSMFVGKTYSAESTFKGLFLSNRETTNTTSGSSREAPFSANGPIVPFEPSRPSRITYYTKTDAVPIESKKTDYGSLFSLISRGESGLNISNVIGVYFGSTIMHGANFGSAVDEKVFLKRLVTIDPYPNIGRWYKVDVKIQWDNHTYSVSLNDTIVTYGQPFKGDDVDGIRLSVTRAVDVWFDEIYVGFDNTMEFSCPITSRTGTSTVAPVQRGWSFDEVHGGNSNGYTEYNVMTRHYNFLDTTGSIPFDGQGAVKDFQDIKLQYADGDYPLTQGKIHAGALVYLTNSSRTIQDPLQASATLDSPVGLWSTGATANNLGDGRQFWYTEYNYESKLTSELNGGVVACSSQDLIAWRFEGIVFHYVNLSDMVFGKDGPFIVERPKVLFNPPTKEYVMWAAMDHKFERSLAMSAIASSPFEDGPFLFRRSFYPDGNQTRDQVIFVNNENLPVLARTYYQTVEFVLPEAMMQPIWESAKSSSGIINFRSNYHRAYYDIGYDNYNDIFNQRWRKEDIPYRVICEDKITGERREVESGTYNPEGFICNDPQERKIVIGQGNPIITSRFVSPNNSENSWWRPTSVPAVEAQAWSANYRDGYCGIRKLNDDYDLNDPNLAKFQPEVRDTCSNIADNPVHNAMPDKLIGILKVVLTRRAKFIAFSQLTEDFLDTTGYLSSFEGELESGNLISLLTELGQFGFGAGNSINSTFNPPKRSEYDTAVDYRRRFSQYILNFNDRATYSLACVLDGVCPVNFRDQLTAGQY
jgi:hypothetical protein